MIALDASVVIALLSPRDSHHGAVASFLRDRAGEPLLMHPLNLAEVLVGGARMGRANEMLADLEALGISVARYDGSEPLRLAMLRAESGLKLPDCCALDVAIVHRSALATVDDRLATVARRRGVDVGP